MLWNSLSSARATLKIPGTGTWHSAALTLSWRWLGRVQLCWHGQEPALVCGSALQRMLSDIHGQGFVHCLPSPLISCACACNIEVPLVQYGDGRGQTFCSCIVGQCKGRFPGRILCWVLPASGCLQEGDAEWLVWHQNNICWHSETGDTSLCASAHTDL